MMKYHAALGSATSTMSGNLEMGASIAAAPQTQQKMMTRR